MDNFDDLDKEIEQALQSQNNLPADSTLVNELATTAQSVIETTQSLVETFEQYAMRDDFDAPLKGFNELEFGETIANNLDIVASPLHHKPMRYFDELGYWQELNVFSLEDYILHAVINKYTAQIGMPEYRTNLAQASLRKVARVAASKVQLNVNPKLLDDPTPNLILFNNGIYDFETNEIRKPTKEDNQTLKLPYDIIPNDETTLAENWLRYITGESAQTLFEIIGYLFYREYKFAVYTFFINGLETQNGANGKSQTLKFIKKVLGGSRNYSTVGLEQLDGKDKFATSAMYNKLANIEGDSPAKYFEESNLLKQLSGGDPVTAQYKGKDQFSFENYAKMIFATNNLPKFKKMDYADTSRFLIIEFEKALSDPQYKDDLRKFNEQRSERESDEQLGKFAWFCIQQFRKVLAQHSERAPFTISEAQERHKQAFVEENNQVLQFVKDEDWLVTDKDMGLDGRIPVSHMYAAYQEYCKNNGMKPYKQLNFKQEMNKLGFITKKARSAKEVVKNAVACFINIEQDLGDYDTSQAAQDVTETDTSNIF